VPAVLLFALMSFRGDVTNPRGEDPARPLGHYATLLHSGHIPGGVIIGAVLTLCSAVGILGLLGDSPLDLRGYEVRARFPRRGARCVGGGETWPWVRSPVAEVAVGRAGTSEDRPVRGVGRDPRVARGNDRVVEHDGAAGITAESHLARSGPRHAKRVVSR